MRQLPRRGRDRPDVAADLPRGVSLDPVDPRGDSRSPHAPLEGGRRLRRFQQRPRAARPRDGHAAGVVRRRLPAGAARPGAGRRRAGQRLDAGRTDGGVLDARAVRARRRHVGSGALLRAAHRPGGRPLDQRGRRPAREPRRGAPRLGLRGRERAGPGGRRGRRRPRVRLGVQRRRAGRGVVAGPAGASARRHRLSPAGGRRSGGAHPLQEDLDHRGTGVQRPDADRAAPGGRRRGGHRAHGRRDHSRAGRRRSRLPARVRRRGHPARPPAGGRGGFPGAAGRRRAAGRVDPAAAADPRPGPGVADALLA